jgi:uncharacterized protein
MRMQAFRVVGQRAGAGKVAQPAPDADLTRAHRGVTAARRDNPGVDYPDYDPTRPTPPLADEELDALDDLLATLPGDGVMNIEALDGYLTALAVGPIRPEAWPTARWLPPVWGGDPAPGTAAPLAPFAPFPSGRQKKRAVVLALRHLHAIGQQLRQDPARWEPVCSVAETDEGDLADAEDWCAGFLHAVALDPAAWAPLFDDAELGPALRPLVRLGADPAELPAPEREGLDDPSTRDALSRAALDVVPRLLARRDSREAGGTARAGG